MMVEIYDAFISCNQQVTTDSRNIIKNDIFFALKGPHFNGNSYAKKALDLGAKFAVIDEKKYYIEGKTFLVKDVLSTLQDLALFHKKKFNTPTIGITGTNGKTTTKELIGSVLKSKYNILITKGNLNNHIGVPLTILKLKKEHDIAIIEMGASKIGDIKELSEIALPNYALITNIGKAHLEGFGNIKNIQKTKLELYNYIIENKGQIIVNSDDDFLLKSIPNHIKTITYGHSNSDFNGKITKENPYLEMSIQYFKSEKIITTNLLGSYNLNNILAAVCFGRVFNVEVDNIFQSISKYEPSNNRSQLIKSKYNQIIADCYNANPTSTLAALKSFINTNFEKKLVILGDMLELGDQEEKEHQQIVHYLKKNNLNAILVGKCYQKSKNDFICFEKTEFLLDYLQNKNFRNHLILLKGSRGIKLESIINQNIL
tara:strand:- start:2836 stop:4122 length:1287 start_codon:yes stop_codon:yes gene_type:complete